MNADALEFTQLTDRVIGCAIQVSNTLGTGFIEKVYENALAIELRDAGLTVSQQQGITVQYKGITVGVYAADLLVEDVLLIELKSVSALNNAHVAQCLRV